jgi:hypothetical protein
VIQRVSDNPIFDAAPLLGFEVGPFPSQQARYVFWRRDAAFHDWQELGQVREIRIAGGNSRYQTPPPSGYELKTGAWFRCREDFQRFLALSRQRGTLRMNADYTMHRDYSRPENQQVIVKVNRRYAEFDNVTVLAIKDQTFDNDGGVRCEVTYRRPYVAPPIVEPIPWPDPSPDPVPDPGFGFGEFFFGEDVFGEGYPGVES